MYWTKMTFMCFLFGIITGSILYVNGQATELRLGNVTGLELRPYEGPIEVFVDGEWGAITRNGVDNVTAKTVCKILGYGYTGFQVDRFQYTGKLKLSHLKCTGNETSILECQQEADAASLIGSALDAPGVHCFDHVFTDVRLSGGKKPTEGMVQVKMDGRWGRVCSYDQSNSAVSAPDVFLTICRTLGFQTYDLQNSFKGYDYDGVDLSWLDLNYLSCTGSEEHFNQCTFQDATIYQPRCISNLVIGCITTLSQNCSSNDTCAGVENAFCSFNICECKKGYLQTGPRQCSAAYTFRLFNTSELYNEGFVEVNISGQWSLITDEFSKFTELTSKVLCQTLGFGYFGFSSWLRYNSELAYNGSMACEMFKCQNGETDATECFENKCHQIDLSDGTLVARLHCYDSRINEIRLEGGLVPNEGRIEFRIGEKWAFVCIYNGLFGAKHEVCKLLGYAERGSIYPRRTSNEDLDAWLAYLDCGPNVTDINDCNYSLNQRSACGYQWDLYCPPLRLADGPSKHSGRIEAGFYGKLHTICADNFSLATANVSCKLLGYSDVLDVTAVPEPFDGEITMLNSTVECNGTETSLEHCNISISSDFTCQSGKAAGVTCLYYQIEDARYYTVNTGPKYVVEVLVQGVWRHVCGSEWDTADTNVACRTLNYASGDGYDSFLSFISQVLPGHLQCTGNESHLNQCTYQKKGYFDHSESCSRHFAAFGCAECRQGFYGGEYCFPCECNATNTKSCDNVTGECFCAAGWVGSTCSTVDIDECATLTHLCPSNKICVNSALSYKCECELGFMEIEDVCKECSPEQFGRNCSSTCICNTDNTIESPDGRKCDKVTGACPCNEAWTGISCISDIDECLNSTICQGQNTQCKNVVGGYECICLQGFEMQNEEECIQVASSNDTMMIILSSVVGGLALVIVLSTICFCQYRRKIKGTADTTEKPVNGNSSRNILTTSIRYRVTEEVYDYINDETDTVDANVLQATNNKEDGYLDIDLVNRNDQVQSSENGAMPYKVNEYLDLNAVDQTPQGYDYPYKGFTLPERGHVDVGGVGRKLPEIPENSQIAGKEGTKDPYSQLKNQKLTEHMYERMADDHGYLKPVRPDNLTSPGPG